MARIVGKRLQERVGQNVVIENRPGGNGAVAVNTLMSAPADGYTFIVQDGSLYSINPHIYSKMAYNVERSHADRADRTRAAVPRRAFRRFRFRR